jgi:hypothetical protein
LPFWRNNNPNPHNYYNNNSIAINNNDNNTITNNTNNKKRNHCLMILVIIISIIIVLIIRTSIISSNMIDMDEGETRKWIENSYTFNKKLYINDYSNEISIYQLSSNSIPSLILIPELNIIHNEIISLSPEEYVYYSYYLNKGSKVSISFSSLNGISFYLFQGKSNFNEWLDDPDGDKKWKISSYSSNNIKQSNTFMIIEDDTYYILFDNDNIISSKLQFQYNCDRTSYDLNSYHKICYKQSYCELDLNLYDDRSIYFQAPSAKDTISIISQFNITENDMNDEFTYQVQISGEPRMTAIIGLIFCLPVFIVFMIIYGNDCFRKNLNIGNTINNDSNAEGYSSIAMTNLEEHEYELSEAIQQANPIMVVATPIPSAPMEK